MDSNGSGTNAPPCASVRACRTMISGKSLDHRATMDTPQATGGRGPKTSRSLPGRRRAETPRNAHGAHHPGGVPALAHTAAPCDSSAHGGARAVPTPRGCKAARRNNAKRQVTLADPVATAARRPPPRVSGQPTVGGTTRHGHATKGACGRPKPCARSGGAAPPAAQKQPSHRGHIAATGAECEGPKGGHRNDRDLRPPGVRWPTARRNALLGAPATGTLHGVRAWWTPWHHLTACLPGWRSAGTEPGGHATPTPPTAAAKGRGSLRRRGTEVALKHPRFHALKRAGGNPPGTAP